MLHHLWTSSITNQDSLNQPQICTFCPSVTADTFQINTFVVSVCFCRRHSTEMKSLLQDLAPQTWNPKTRFTELNVYPLWPAAISRCSRSEAGSGLPSLFVKSLPFDPGQPWRNAAPADTLQPGRLPNGLLALGRALWTWAGWAGKGSGSGSHQGFAKWWWVMSAVWGGEGIMVDWEYRGSSVHTILIHSLSKDSPAMFARLVRRLTHHTCVAFDWEVLL